MRTHAEYLMDVFCRAKLYGPLELFLTELRRDFPSHASDQDSIRFRAKVDGAERALKGLRWNELFQKSREGNYALDLMAREEILAGNLALEQGAHEPAIESFRTALGYLFCVRERQYEPANPGQRRTVAELLLSLGGAMLSKSDPHPGNAEHYTRASIELIKKLARTSTKSELTELQSLYQDAETVLQKALELQGKARTFEGRQYRFES